MKGIQLSSLSSFLEQKVERAQLETMALSMFQKKTTHRAKEQEVHRSLQSPITRYTCVARADSSYDLNHVENAGQLFGSPSMQLVQQSM